MVTLERQSANPRCREAAGLPGFLQDGFLHIPCWKTTYSVGFWASWNNPPLSFQRNRCYLCLRFRSDYSKKQLNVDADIWAVLRELDNISLLKEVQRTAQKNWRRYFCETPSWLWPWIYRWLTLSESDHLPDVWRLIPEVWTKLKTQRPPQINLRLFFFADQQSIMTHHVLRWYLAYFAILEWNQQQPNEAGS